MPCEPFELKTENGMIVRGILCSRGHHPRDKCSVCGQPSDKLCMSRDTYLVRMDYQKKMEIMKRAIIEALGNTDDYEGPILTGSSYNAPTGSEGSLQYSISGNYDHETNAMTWGCVSVWGDLRDFGEGEVPDLEKWFVEGLIRLLGTLAKKVEGNPPPLSVEERLKVMLGSFPIRDAVLSIDVEDSPRRILSYSDATGLVTKVDVPKIGEE